MLYAGIYGGGATPVPIPNTEVKSSCADGSPLGKSRSMPAYSIVWCDLSHVDKLQFTVSILGLFLVLFFRQNNILIGT